MTDVVQVAVIMSLPGMMGVALSFYNGVVARRTERHAQETAKAMILLEKNTNSIKDALVATTKRESYAAGVADQRERGQQIADAVEKAVDKAVDKAALRPEIARQEKDFSA